MAKSPTERITAIERVIDSYGIRLDVLEKGVYALDGTQAELAKEVRGLDRSSALLQREVEELRKWKEEVKKATKNGAASYG